MESVKKTLDSHAQSFDDFFYKEGSGPPASIGGRRVVTPGDRRFDQVTLESLVVVWAHGEWNGAGDHCKEREDELSFAKLHLAISYEVWRARMGG